MYLDLSQEQLGTLVSSAILKSMSQPQRDQLIREAVQKLIAPDRTNPHNESDLQVAFRHAVRIVAQKMIMESLENDPAFKATLKGMMDEIVARATTGEARAKVVERMASNFETFLCGTRY